MAFNVYDLYEVAFSLFVPPSNGRQGKKDPGAPNENII